MKVWNFLELGFEMLLDDSFDIFTRVADNTLCVQTEQMHELVDTSSPPKGRKAHLQDPSVEASLSSVRIQSRPVDASQ
jgi:hypothetical protein